MEEHTFRVSQVLIIPAYFLDLLELKDPSAFEEQPRSAYE